MSEAEVVHGDSDRLSRMVRIDVACGAFESAWRAGKRPTIEDFLDETAESDRVALFPELLRVELELRRKAGERPTAAEYGARFPEWQEAIAALCASATAVDSQAASLGSTVVTLPFPEADPLAAAGLSAIGGGQPVGLPARFGRYRVKRELGAGTFGTVYLAHDPKLNRRVAIKVPNMWRIGGPEDVRAYVDEARRVAQLDHPGIVPVYDVGQTDDGRCFVVSKFVAGTTLEARLETDRPSREESVSLVAAVAEALHHAHLKGFVHRDVKPANILLDEAGRPQVADFGLALHENEQALRKGEEAGSPAYMAPEQTLGKAHHLDGRADVWALGVILYELLTGRRPFAGKTLGDLYDEIRHREPRPLRMIDGTIPAELERICLVALSKPVGQRYATAQDLADDLRSFDAGGSSARIGNGSTVLSPSRPAVRLATWPLVGLVVAGLVLALAVGGTWWFLRLLRAGGFDERIQATPDGVAGTWRFLRDSGAGKTPDAGEATSVASTEDQSPNTTTGPTAAADASLKPPLSATLDVRLWTPNDPVRKGLSLSDPPALPLRTGDQIRIEATVDAPAYLYLVWVDPQGRASPVYPWRPGDWTQRPAVERAVTKLSLPEQSDLGWPLVGPAGMETLVLLVRREPLPADVGLPALFADLPRQTAQQTQSLVWLEEGSVPARRDRAPLFFDPQRIDDPVLSTQRLLAERLRPHFDRVQAVSFANAGQPSSK